MDAQTVVTAVAVLQAVAIIGGGFYFTGKITTVLEELRRIGFDHEDRIRYLERDRRKNLHPTQTVNS